MACCLVASHGIGPSHGTSKHDGLDRVHVSQAPLSLSQCCGHFFSILYLKSSSTCLSIPGPCHLPPPPPMHFCVSPESHSKHRLKPASRIYVLGLCSLGTVSLQGVGPQQPHLYYRSHAPGMVPADPGCFRRGEQARVFLLLWGILVLVPPETDV